MFILNREAGSTWPDQDYTDPIADTAVRFVVTNMGNGVDRIDRATRLTTDDAMGQTKGWHPIPFPLPTRILDLACTAITALECADRIATDVIEGRVRYIDERTIELTVWASGGGGGI